MENAFKIIRWELSAPMATGMLVLAPSKRKRRAYAAAAIDIDGASSRICG
jgi:hypothetical protein